MSDAIAKPWPPPPDMESLKELFAVADVEGLIGEDCPADEYDPEARHFFEATHGWPSAKLIAEHTLPLLETMWAKQFGLDERQLAVRRPRLAELAAQIERFFGPQAQPQVRGS